MPSDGASKRVLRSHGRSPDKPVTSKEISPEKKVKNPSNPSSPKAEDKTDSGKELPLLKPAALPKLKALAKRKRKKMNVDTPDEEKKEQEKRAKLKDGETLEMDPSSMGPEDELELEPLDTEDTDDEEDDLELSLTAPARPKTTDPGSKLQDIPPNSVLSYSLPPALSVFLSPSVLAKALPKVPSTMNNMQWGTLIPQYPNLPTAVLVGGGSFSIGRNSRCNLCLKDAGISGLLSRICYNNGMTYIESLSGSGMLSVNGRLVRKGSRVILKNGDEIIISASKTYAFIYQALNPPQPVAQTGVASTLTQGLPDALTTSLEATKESGVPGIMTRSRKRRSSEPSKDKTAKLNTFLTRLRDDLDMELPPITALSGLSSPIPMETTPNSTPATPVTPNSATTANTTATTTTTTTTTTSTASSPPSTTNTPSATGPPSPFNDSSKSEAAAMKQMYKDEFAKLLTSWDKIDVSFDEFPYYLSDQTKELLIHSAYIFLMKPEYAKFTTDLPTVSRRILLSGPTGTEIYQETLVKALARHFKTSLLIFDASNLSPSADGTSQSSLPEAINSDDAELSDMWSSFDPLARAPDSSRRNFKIGDRVRYVGPGPQSGGMLNGLLRQLHADVRRMDAPHRGPHVGYKGKVMLTFDDNPRKVGVRFDKSIPAGVTLGNLCEDNHGFFVDPNELKFDTETGEASDALAIESLFELLTAEENNRCILYIKDAEKSLMSSYERYSNFKKELDKVTTPLIVIAGSTTASDAKRDKAHAPGLVFSKTSNSHTALLDFSIFDHLSRIEERAKENSKVSKVLAKLLPNKITINPPTEGDKLAKWKSQIEKDVERLKVETNKQNIKGVLDKNNIHCETIEHAAMLKTQVLSPEYVDKVIGWSISHHLMNNDTVELKNEKLVIMPRSIDFGINMLENSKPTDRHKSLKDVETENEFEKKLLGDVIPPNEIAVGFNDIGALDKVKDTLKELVMLPLQRPELFRKGALTKPCKGILLFGPPGTGKTMLAKAVATESGANFINVSMSSIGSKWFGEGEKYARAVFTLASKISPCVIFIDEVDSILGKRERAGEHEAMRKIKNEFMSMWDGLKTRENERVLVLAATNRPFDLDDAVLRRLPRRLLVDLPDSENRVKILRVILGKEDLGSDVDLQAIASMTEGYSGSDLQNLCTAAAYQPIRELLAKEKETGEAAKSVDPFIRAVGMKDFEKAKEEISASVSEDAFSVAELRKWNDMYGEGGSRRQKSLSYFM